VGKVTTNYGNIEIRLLVYQCYEMINPKRIRKIEWISFDSTLLQLGVNEYYRFDLAKIWINNYNVQFCFKRKMAIYKNPVLLKDGINEIDIFIFTL